jgi:hypothetical protein
MTFKQMVRALERNAPMFAEEGDIVKAQACRDLVVFIRERGFENTPGHIDIVVDSPRESV